MTNLFKPNKEFDMDRQKANLEIIEIIKLIAEKNASLRFGQILTSLGIEEFTDPTYEPSIVLARAQKSQIYKDTIKGRR